MKVNNSPRESKALRMDSKALKRAEEDSWHKELTFSVEEAILRLKTT